MKYQYRKPHTTNVTVTPSRVKNESLVRRPSPLHGPQARHSPFLPQSNLCSDFCRHHFHAFLCGFIIQIEVIRPLKLPVSFLSLSIDRHLHPSISLNVSVEERGPLDCGLPHGQ